ncbi:phosphate ABC transporter ATP-binding protein PstB [Nodosilinea nodulosa]|uniref:phosphate ABC transporter ATP-binding protein PstB n=1 Tax=Nodosilinea nodulosa TaxID=416001 RepID=UPI0002E28B7D|nr:phosphate ABC transporter ATP-binding protein PstB [Nodosilinea nodulosa]
MEHTAQHTDVPALRDTETVIATEQLNVYYGDFLALRNVNMAIPERKVTALIGPSGCGKSTLIRCFNRLNDLIDSFHLDGRVTYYGQDLYQDVDAVQVRRRIGMVFQQPNPFPKSIYDNIAFGARATGLTTDLDELVERSLKRSALWEEVKDKLKTNGLSLSGGQQQRLCIARAISTEPDVVLMDEPCSSLDPLSTLKIESLIRELAEEYTIIIVTHNMQQAARMADYTAFFNAEATEDGKRSGYLVEFAPTRKIFDQPAQEATRNYVNGQFG